MLYGGGRVYRIWLQKNQTTSLVINALAREFVYIANQTSPTITQIVHSQNESMQLKMKLMDHELQKREQRQRNA